MMLNHSHSSNAQVSLMKKLRHPNTILFMGAVASPERLCIVTEFLPRCVSISYNSKNQNKRLELRTVFIVSVVIIFSSSVGKTRSNLSIMI
jgi:hypothetical protein